MTRQPTAPEVAFGVLGPVEASTGGGPVPLKGARQRTVLARLLIARGRVVPVDRLAGDLWEEPTSGAVAAIRTFVSDLRRALEPDRPPRQPARLLVTAPPGYALRAAPDAVDAWRFESRVAESAPLLAAGRAGAALAGLDDALGLWRGPAYAEYAGQSWARAEVDRLDEVRMLAVERRAEALLALGRAAEAAVDLRAAAESAPLREDTWQLLATALYRAGRQGEALAALHRARQTLAAQLGVDPGPRLRQLQADILAHAPHLDPSVTQAGTVVGVPLGGGVAPGSGRVGAVAVPDREPAVDEPRPFVGRDEELARLEQTADAVTRHGRPTLALVSGEAGAGKTALAEALTRRLSARGWATAWGRVPEYEGAPADWPWVQITDALTGPTSDRDQPGPASARPPSRTGTGPDLTGPARSGSADGGSAEDPAVARFRLRRAAVARLAAVTGRGPTLMVVDDLHRADEATLDLLTALLVDPEPFTGPVLVVGTYRATEITPELTGALARLARTEPVRVYLGGLSETATGQLARTVARRDLDPPTALLIHRRSGGNPFFVRELARLLAAEGVAALQTVPAGVRDVIRHRLARLPEPAQMLLRQAAVIGRDIDPEVLTALAGDGVPIIDALDSALEAGFLVERGADGRPGFTHILVRDTLYGDLSALRRARWHADVAEAIERLHPDDVTALAHHFDRAASSVTAPRAARYSRAAAEQAERRSNPHEAARLWRQALAAHDRADATDVRGRLAAVMGLGRTVAVTGDLDQARRYRAEAITTAARLGDPELTATVVTAFDVPAVWTRNDDEDLSRLVVGAAEQSLAALGEDRAERRSRLLSTIALETRGDTTDRGRRAAYEAEAIARTVGDPAVLAFALDARFMHAFGRTGLSGERAGIGAELVDLGARHELVTFEVLGHLILLQARCAVADLDAADVHARAADRLAQRYDLPLVGVFTQCYAALRLTLTGHLAQAEAAYRAASARIDGGGMPGMAQGLLPLALLSLDLRKPVPDGTGWPDRDWGPYEPWVLPLTLLAAGRREEAAVALSLVPESPRDLLLEARLCLVARAALALDDRTMITSVYRGLLPAAGELAGAGSGVLSFGPVAGYLGDLATALGLSAEAAGHYRTAREGHISGTAGGRRHS
ncbi:BTAD domain-containing putative transcriptional regulator [Micromonospora sp. NPDC049523]|uniref:BTAD domain-containing putative transcriptional regulator n=1 Tax=Micromonospora sp. NPDC049523 TaxID=3155921 RepID=UPI00344A6B7C